LAGYLIANIDVKEQAAFDEYRAKVGATIAQHGGRYIVRGGAIEPLEGNLPLQRLIILEFPSLGAARNFYESAEYAPLLKLRLTCTSSDVVLVDGYTG
jgi:uncharacterized protein (DUF1330 family)